MTDLTKPQYEHGFWWWYDPIRRGWLNAARHNVAGNRLAEGKSGLTGLLGGPARSEKE